ncbi:substrate-binding periplasmic protein [Brachybacterium ginsengisoli]|nr:transporter substrate-binding domain-containing protein [Brachybacterium ginsengisoli]
MIRPPAQRRRGISWPILALAAVLVVCLVLVLTIVRPSPPERNQPLQISTSEWLPYISPDLPDDGPVAAMLTEVFGRAGYSPEFVFGTWPRAERDVRSGATIGMAPVIVSETRSSFALYTDPLLDFTYTLHGRKGADLDAFSDRADLKGVRVARIDGYKYWDALDRSGATFIDYPSSLAAFTAVKDGEADVVAEGSIAGRSVLESAAFGGDASDYAEVAPRTDLTSSTQGLHLLIKDTPEGRTLQKQFNAALEDFRGSEDYDRLVAGLTDTSAEVVLDSAAGGAVELMDADGEPMGSTPSGTQAFVARWPDDAPASDTLIAVKVLDGPLRGRLLWARLEDLEITHD